MSELLAKSSPKVTLKKHIEDGLSVWEFMKVSFPAAPHCAKNKNFWELLRLAIITHDLGKAHSEFQKLLNDKKNDWYFQRHELFSLPFANCLKNLSENNKQIIMRVIAAHHKTYSWLNNFIENNYELNPQEYENEFSKIDVEKVSKLISYFAPNLIEEKIIPDSPLKIIENYKREIKDVLLGRQDKIHDHFTLLLLMGAFHHCDHLASANIINFDRLEDSNFYFLDNFQNQLLQQGHNLYYHQKEVKNANKNVILTAPTGSGKTETSLLWLRHQLTLNGQGRTFFVLPYTASINAMYKRLSNDEEGLGKNSVGMLHGKLDFVLYETFFEETGSLQELKDQINNLKQTFKTLQSPLKILTPFQLLKHLFGLKGFEKGIFEWVGGYFIFDEIHAYDPEVTAQIVVLLEYLTKYLQAKILIMTATLPTFLKEIIGEAIGDFKQVKAGSTLYNAFNRHLLKLKDGLLSENLDLIRRDLKDHKKVLVVCNTVDQSRFIFNQLHKDYDSLLIHGRFTSKDRTQIENQLDKQLPQLLIGTQTIEVSLDIDYDVIYTEPAPLDALIQRFGRVNRENSKDPCSCFVFTERNDIDKFIYSQDIIDKTIDVLRIISNKNDGIIQEIELQQYIDQVYPGFDEKSKEKYDKIYGLLSQYVKRLTPFEPSKENEEDYYKQFDGVKVLPAFYEKEYKSALDKFDFIGAEQLKLSIRKNWFATLIGTPALEKHIHIISSSNNSKEKIVEVNYFKINKRYRPSTGLEFDKDEDPKIIVDSSEYIF